MRFEIGFGLGFDRDGVAINTVQRQEALKLILTQAALEFGGCNLTFGQGAWLDGDNLVVEESATLVVHPLPTGRLYDDETSRVTKLAEFIRKALNQKAVIVAKQVGTASMVEV